MSTASVMSRERWERTGELLEGALALSPGERPAYLAAACAGDSDLRAEVEELLAVDPDLLAGLERPALDLAVPSFPPWPTVPGYDLVREIGRGGVGEVYEGRPEGEPRRAVAIKVLKRGMDSEEVLARFRVERQILGNLKHPNIVHLFDAGLCGDGRPFLVMERIEGEPIDGYARRHGLDARRILGLLLKVCDAVQVAHRNLVVHRDLKPGNILVDVAGEPKLIDFGIAKLLEPGYDGAAPATRLGGQPMTSLYASPEQLAGGPITTATDVYALGVVLCELLSGERPTPEGGVGAAGAAPSGLRGDLAAITGKALRRRPEERYGSVAELAEDLRRHLAGLPVEARPLTWTYRATRFLYRRRRESLVAALCLLALAGYGARRVAEHRRLTAELERTGRLARFLRQVIAPPNVWREGRSELTVREILDRGRKKIEAELANEPELQAIALTSIGEAYLRIGLDREAEEALDTALETRRKALGPEHALVADSLEVKSGFEVHRGRFAEAEKLLREAYALRLRVFRAADPRLTDTVVGLAALRMDRGHYGEAESGFRDALVRLKEAGEGGTKAEAAVRGNLALCLFYRGRLAAAEGEARTALALSLRHLETGHPQISAHWTALARILAAQRDWAAARELVERAWTVVERQHGEEHPASARLLTLRSQIAAGEGDLPGADGLASRALAVWRRNAGSELHPDTASTLVTLAGIRRRLGRLGEALPLASEAVALRLRSLGPDHPDLAGALLELARVRRDQGAGAEAASLAERARGILLRGGLADHPWLAELAALKAG